MKGYILLEDVEFFAYHGVYEDERKNGNDFVVNLKIVADLEKASLSDKLEDTVNYAVVYDILSEEMSISSDLLEHVAGRILRRIKKEMSVGEITIKISKKNPPIEGRLGAASIILVD